MEELHAESAVGQEITGSTTEVLSLAAFSALDPGSRAQVALRRTTAETVAGDAREWALQVSVEKCGLGDAMKQAPVDVMTKAADKACDQSVEDAIMQAVIGRVNRSGWDPASFKMIAEVVAASS
eukprot:CAMPEP_0115524046 /NCGR_PEP_ID=MMETSP0271-20121206/80969_1 /TAXON_ID=71861 /ORGANISM="Scrippsiella trochoidea, Strain CCMP3099" /LENGTH=123 /DNA_ID=CAMNT_0002955515 /DNA_START=67 /DNA_END=435 /DNA_ORIENTATION=+